MVVSDNSAKLTRTTFSTSRMMEFLSRKELIAQTGHDPSEWPLVALKELVDNALDACEEAGIPPKITVTVDDNSIIVADNGLGIPENVIDDVLDFSRRTSSREAYVAPDRGAQGNALKTLIGMPFALDGQSGRLDVNAGGIRHEITLKVEPIRQEPLIGHKQYPDDQAAQGTAIRIYWPNAANEEPQEASTVLPVKLARESQEMPAVPSNSPCSLLYARHRFLQFAENFTLLNPNLDLLVNWQGRQRHFPALTPDWKKWNPSDPTPPSWYDVERFDRLIAAYIAQDAERGLDRTVREFIKEFRGLSGTAKQKTVLDECGLVRTKLSELAGESGIDRKATTKLLAAIVRGRPKPAR